MNMVGPVGKSPVTSRTLPFDTSVSNQARVFDFLLGGCFR